MHRCKVLDWTIVAEGRDEQSCLKAWNKRPIPEQESGE